MNELFSWGDQNAVTVAGPIQSCTQKIVGTLGQLHHKWKQKTHVWMLYVYSLLGSSKKEGTKNHMYQISNAHN